MNKCAILITVRDNGFDFYWYDKYCQNLFAKTFESKFEHYNILTAFELMEHLPQPYVDIDKMIKLADNIIFSTELIPNNVPKVNEWWYYSPETGQHVSFYTKKTLQIIAEKYNLNYVGNNFLHVFTNKSINSLEWRLVLKCSKLINQIIRYNSFLSYDYEKVRNIIIR